MGVVIAFTPRKQPLENAAEAPTSPAEAQELNAVIVALQKRYAELSALSMEAVTAFLADRGIEVDDEGFAHDIKTLKPYLDGLLERRLGLQSQMTEHYARIQGIREGKSE